MKLSIVRLLLVAALLTALPAASAAQYMPIPSAGITVTGRGVVAVPPDSLRFQVMLRTLPGTSLDDAGKTVAQTLRANGVPDATWAVPLDGVLTPNSSPAVVGTVAKPTRDKLESMLRATAAALPASLVGTLTPQSNVSWTLRVDDCEPAYARATSAALEQAHREAERLARDAGVTLGSVVGILRTELNAAGCATKPDNEPTGFQSRRVDAYGNEEVVVTASLTVTYSIH